MNWTCFECQVAFLLFAWCFSIMSLPLHSLSLLSFHLPFTLLSHLYISAQVAPLFWAIHFVCVCVLYWSDSSCAKCSWHSVIVGAQMTTLLWASKQLKCNQGLTRTYRNLT
jgi:hypothetical protein